MSAAPLSCCLISTPLVWSAAGKDGGLLDQYANDRPYAASSFQSVAIAKCCARRLAVAASNARSWCSSRDGYAAARARCQPREAVSSRRCVSVMPLPLAEKMPEWGPRPGPAQVAADRTIDGLRAALALPRGQSRPCAGIAGNAGPDSVARAARYLGCPLGSRRWRV
jgi:hypothetical protein